jgi:hypothetical protein
MLAEMDRGGRAYPCPVGAIKYRTAWTRGSRNLALRFTRDSSARKARNWSSTYVSTVFTLACAGRHPTQTTTRGQGGKPSHHKR